MVDIIAETLEPNLIAKNKIDLVLTTFTAKVIELTRAGKEVNLRAFGTFSEKSIASKTGKVPGTGDTYVSKPSKKLSFKASSSTKVKSESSEA